MVDKAVDPDVNAEAMPITNTGVTDAWGADPPSAVPG